MPTKPARHKPATASTHTHGWVDDRIRGNRHERGYGKEWEATRLRIMERDDRLCQPCLHMDMVTPASQVDHIVSKAAGGSDSDDNLQAICVPCHKIKTAQERWRGRGEGSK